MLPSKEIQNPEAIEKYICEPFEKEPRFPMDKGLTEILVELMLSDKVGTTENFNKEEEKNKPFIINVVAKSIKYRFSFEVNDARLIVFIAMLAESPGMAIMYLTYMQYWCKKHNVRELDLETFCERIFPWGFPSKEHLTTLWDKTKVHREGSGGSDNLIDYQSAAKSIHFEQETVKQA